MNDSETSPPREPALKAQPTHLKARLSLIFSNTFCSPVTSMTISTESFRNCRQSLPTGIPSSLANKIPEAFSFRSTTAITFMTEASWRILNMAVPPLPPPTIRTSCNFLHPDTCNFFHTHNVTLLFET